MAIDVRVPEVGESVTEAILAEWFKADGDRVARDEELFLLETDKITLEVAAEADGVLEILVEEGETVEIGAVVGRIAEEEGEGEEPEPSKAEEPEGEDGKAARTTEAEEAEQEEARETEEVERETSEEDRESAEAEPEAREGAGEPRKVRKGSSEEPADLAPSVRRLLREHDLDPGEIQGTGPGGRITKGDVILHLEEGVGREKKGPPRGEAEKPESPEKKGAGGKKEAAEKAKAPTGSRAAEWGEVERKPLSPIRKRIAERLLDARRNTAMLTTFNEIDMGRVMELRARHKEAFKEKHGVSLGIVSFFVKAVVEALEDFPALNAFIEGDEVVYHRYHNIGIAVGAERGLVVPVIRNAEALSIAGIEKAVAGFVKKIEENKLELSDLEGGTFSITNGGVFGSLLSTPILNPPQSGILGLHKIEKRPVVVDDEIAVRPMMYVALSYDHRIVDGRDSVRFLAQVKAVLEDPERLLVEV